MQETWQGNDRSKIVLTLFDSEWGPGNILKISSMGRLQIMIIEVQRFSQKVSKKAGSFAHHT